MWSCETTWFKGQVTLRMGFPYGKSHPCQVWWSYALWEWRYYILRIHSRSVTILPILVDIGTVVGKFNGFSLSRDLERPRDQRIIWLYRQKSIKVSYHPARFGGHSHSGSRDIFLVCHVIMTRWHKGGRKLRTRRRQLQSVMRFTQTQKASQR